MALRAPDTIDVIEEVVDQMTPTIEINQEIDNSNGTFTLDTFNTYWIQERKKYIIGLDQYKVISFVINTSITIKPIKTGVGLPGVSSFVLPKPKFFHGTPKMAGKKQSAQKSIDGKTPFIWLYEILEEEVIVDPRSSIGRKASIELAFMNETRTSDYDAPAHKVQVIEPMSQMVDLFFKIIDDDTRNFRQMESYKSTSRANWGKFTVDEGNKTLIFDQNLSGKHIKTDLTLTKRACDPRQFFPDPTFTFSTISDVDTLFAMTYTDGDTPQWISPTQVREGASVTFNFINPVEKDIRVMVESNDMIIAFNTTAWQNKGITKMNLSKCTGLGSDLRLNTNSMTEFIAPDSSGVFTRLHLYKNDLTIADLRTMILGGDIRVEDQDDLEILLFGLSDELVTNLVGDKCSIKNLDLSPFSRLSVIIDFSFNKIETFISGNSAEVILIIKFNNNFLEIFDISGYTKAGNEWRWNDNPGLKIVKLPPTTEAVKKIFGFKCDTDYVDYSMIPNLLVGDSTFVNIGNCNTGSADVDQILVDIAAIISAREAPGGDYISRLITINGSNDAPGAAGLAAIATLATFGISVTATP